MKKEDILYIHYLSLDPKGPIVSTPRSVEQGGRTAVISRGGRWVVACQPRRKHLSRVNGRGNRVLEHFAATGDTSVVTCPECLKSSYYMRDTKKESG